LLSLDLAGTFVFALSGAMTAVKHRLDVFGILVLSLAAATFGGMARDVLIGAVPPAALSDWRYITVSVVAGLIIFLRYPTSSRLRTPILILDGAGLALFAVSGALKALAFGVTPFAAIMLGVLTGVGGGVARDILVAEIPTVLRAELYAVAALAGATLVVVGRALQFPSIPITIAGAAVCFGLRFMAIRHGWRLPVACHSEQLTFDTLPPTNTVDDAGNARREAAPPTNSEEGTR
ncbi:MAG TPA: trimeric intracellular cation channel family protein, partial [Chthoniobacterales bacterium]|nr:trimeric intracellular cation channel family protein [Chthoniobacterales bacterium]